MVLIRFLVTEEAFFISSTFYFSLRIYNFLALYVPGYIRLITSVCAHLDERHCARQLFIVGYMYHTAICKYLT